MKSHGRANLELLVYTHTPPPPRPATTPAVQPRPVAPNAIQTSQGGGRPRGTRTRTGVNTDPLKQPDETLRALNTEPTTDGDGNAEFPAPPRGCAIYAPD